MYTHAEAPDHTGGQARRRHSRHRRVGLLRGVSDHQLAPAASNLASTLERAGGCSALRRARAVLDRQARPKPRPLRRQMSGRYEPGMRFRGTSVSSSSLPALVYLADHDVDRRADLKAILRGRCSPTRPSGRSPSRSPRGRRFRLPRQVRGSEGRSARACPPRCGPRRGCGTSGDRRERGTTAPTPSR